jgi:protein CWC15
MRFYAPSQARSVKDIAGFTKMKYRQDGQASKEELARKDARADLERREMQHFSKLSKEEFLSERERDLKLLEGSEMERTDAVLIHHNELDADVEDDEAETSGSDDDEDDDDDEAELLAELERIREERAEQARVREEEAAREEEARRKAEVAGGNPLLQEQLASQSGDFRMKRRWDDDVVFRNQAANEPAKQRRFINDTVRNDFHKRFMSRYFS